VVQGCVSGLNSGRSWLGWGGRPCLLQRAYRSAGSMPEYAGDGTRVSGRASALLGVAGHSLALHRLLLCGGPTYLLLSIARTPPASQDVTTEARQRTTTPRVPCCADGRGRRFSFHLCRYLAGQLTEIEQRTIGFPWSPANAKRALASTGGTVRD